MKLYSSNAGVFAQRTVTLDENKNVTGDTLSYMFKDQIGSTLMTFGADGKLTGRYAYEPFGKMIYREEAASNGTRRTFTGHMLEDDEGLYYCHARWYDSTVGRFLQADSVLDGFNRYAYCRNNPVSFCDPTGMSTDVDEKTGTILNAQYDGDNGVYAFPTYNGERCEGPGLLIGLTGTPGYFASSDSNYIGQNISNYGSGFAYGDFQFSIEKEEIIGYALPNTWETMGDALSTASFFLNCANLGCTLTGQFAAAEGCGTVAACCDLGATFCYFASGCNDKAVTSLIGFGLDLVPAAACYCKPTLKAGYNAAAHRFINPSTGRFITNTAGYANYISGPAVGITYTIGSTIYSNNKGKK